MELTIKKPLPTMQEFMEEIGNTFRQIPAKATVAFGCFGTLFLQVFGFDLSEFVSSIPAVAGALMPIIIGGIFTVRKKYGEIAHERKLQKIAAEHAKKQNILALEKERELMRLAMMDRLIEKGIIIPGTMKPEAILEILKKYEDEI